MPVNLYDDRKVSLRRPYGNGDLDIVRALYTRRKANVTKALLSVLKKQHLCYKLTVYNYWRDANNYQQEKKHLFL